VPPLPSQEALRTVQSAYSQQPRRTSELDAEANQKQRSTDDKASVATRIVRLAEGLELFHDAQGRGYIVLPAEGHSEVRPLDSRAAKAYLARAYYRETKSAANRNSISDALLVLENRARFEGPERPVYIRVAPYEGGIILDLGDAGWRAVHITKTGWQV